MSEEKKTEEITQIEEKKPTEPVTLEKINELLTNNLKWSKIIYEQNRKINRKLFWASFFDYFKMTIILVPLVVGFFYLLPGINNLLRTVDVFSGVNVCKDGATEQGVFIDALLNQLPFEQSKKEQIKALLR